MDSNNNLMSNNAQNNGNVNVVSSAVNPPLNTLNPPVVKPINPPIQPPIKSPKNNKIILGSLLFILLIGLTIGVYKLSGSRFIKRVGEVFEVTQYPSPTPSSNPPPSASPSAPGCTTIKCDWCTNRSYCEQRRYIFEDDCHYCDESNGDVDGCCWPPGHQTGSLTCSADGNGTSITNNSASAIHVTGNSYAHYCAKNPGCGCAGTPGNIDINLGPGQTQSYGFDNSHDPCQWSWQTDIEVTSSIGSCSDADSGCEVGGTCASASPSPSSSPAANLVCRQLNSNVQNLDNVKVDDNIDFTCLGTATNITINHYDYRLSSNNGTSYTTLSHSNALGSASYTIQSAGNYIVQCRTCSSVDSSHCTDWGLASGWRP